MIKDLNFLAMVQEEFNEVFPNVLEIFYYDCRDKYEASLRRIWEKEWKEHDNIPWYKSLLIIVKQIKLIMRSYIFFQV